MKILYMGTPDFAVTPLKKLYEGGHEIVGVVTQPDKEQGRKMILTPSPVKVAATELGIPVFTPTRLKDGAFLPVLEELNPDLIVVVAYGRILRDYILDYPKFGCINLHGSLLPAYRGAAPMQRAIMDGVKTIGVTVMYMNEGLDTGDMIEKFETDLTDEMTFGDVHDILSENGSELLLKVIDTLEKEGSVRREKQDDALSNYAAKIEDGDMLIDFSLTARQTHNIIRALSPSPLAFSYLSGKKMKLVCACIAEEESDNGDSFGTVISINKNGFVVACKKGSLLIKTVVPEGKKQMDARAFINGRGADVGDRFSGSKS